MKHELLLKVAPFSGSRVKPFDGVSRYLSTGDLQDSSISFVAVTYKDKPSRAAVSVERGDVLFARMKGTTKVLEIDNALANIIVSTGFAVVRPTEKCDGRYLSIYLRSAEFESQKEKYCSGAIQPAITNTGVERIIIPLPPLDDQTRIAYLLGKVEGLIARRKQNLKQLDSLIKSIFLEMFGDPVRNAKGWDRPGLNHFGTISTGNTPPKKDSLNYSDQHIEWIKTDNITADSVYITQAVEFLSEAGTGRGKTVKEGALLVACIAGSLDSIGRAALTNRTVAFNQQINAIQPNNEVNPTFLYYLVKLSKNYIQSHASKGMKNILTKGVFENIKMIKPPLCLQNRFSVIAKKVEGIKFRYKNSLSDLENLYGALSQKAFKGELDLSRVVVTKEIRQEMNPIVTVTSAMKSVETINFPLPGESASIESSGDLKSLIENWLGLYVQQLDGKPLSVENFVTAAQKRLTELINNNEEEFELGLNAYDQISTWVFKAITNGHLKQDFDATSKSVQVSSV